VRKRLKTGIRVNAASCPVIMKNNQLKIDSILITIKKIPVVTGTMVLTADGRLVKLIASATDMSVKHSATLIFMATQDCPMLFSNVMPKIHPHRVRRLIIRIKAMLIQKAYSVE
jgi:hypothetical protein